MPAKIWSLTAETIDGKKLDLSVFKGKVLLIVNTASKCGYTGQYNWLEAMYKKYKHLGFEILAFPCGQFANQEFGKDTDIKEFCELNYQTSFTLFKKVDVFGQNAHPLFDYLSNELRGIFWTKRIKWNFTKFLLNRDGVPKERFSPRDDLDKVEKAIQELL